MKDNEGELEVCAEYHHTIGWVDPPLFQPDTKKLMLPDLLINKDIIFIFYYMPGGRNFEITEVDTAFPRTRHFHFCTEI